MAAVTINSADAGQMVRVLHELSITNLADTATGTYSRAVKVPDGAKSCTMYLFIHSTAGTSPLVDFVVKVPDFGSDAKMLAPTDDTDSLLGNQAWDGITQVTGNGPYVITVQIDPLGDAADDTGSATASCTYAIKAPLPPWLWTLLTLDGTTADEDYSITLVAVFKR